MQTINGSHHMRIDHRYTNHNLSDHAVALNGGIVARHGNSPFRAQDFSYREDLIDELLEGGFLRHAADGRLHHSGKVPMRVPGYVPPAADDEELPK